MLPKNLKDIQFKQWDNSKNLRETQASPCHFLLGIAFSVLVYILLIVLEKNLPEPVTINDGYHNHSERFVAERARNYLINLTSLGPRPVGSEANELHAVQMLLSEIKIIADQANPDKKIEWDLQRVSGAFSLEFLDGMTNVYKNVQNVVARIGPVDTSRHSLLINCHFDSVLDSPGN